MKYKFIQTIIICFWCACSVLYTFASAAELKEYALGEKTLAVLDREIEHKEPAIASYPNSSYEDYGDAVKVVDDIEYMSLRSNKDHIRELSALSDYRQNPSEGFSHQYTEAMIDEDHDGIDDYLSIKTGVNLKGTLSLMAYIADSQDQLFLLSVTNWYSDTNKFNEEIELRIDAQKLRDHGVSGTFTIKGLILQHRNVYGEVVESKLNAYTTQPYYFAPVPPKAIVFTDTHYDDRGVDINGNGLFEYIEMAVEVDVSQSGQYRFESIIGFANSERTVDLPVGKSVVWLPVWLESVVSARDKKPLAIAVIRAFDADTNEVAIVNPDYVLKTQGLEKFEPLTVQIDETSLKDTPVNLDHNPKVDVIRLDMAIVTQPEGVGPYQLSYKVYDKHGALIIEIVNQPVELMAVGRQTVTVNMPVDPFVRHGVDGPYYLRTFFLNKRSGIWIDSLHRSDHETQAYRVEDLQNQ